MCGGHRRTIARSFTEPTIALALSRSAPRLRPALPPALPLALSRSAPRPGRYLKVELDGRVGPVRVGDLLVEDVHRTYGGVPATAKRARSDEGQTPHPKVAGRTAGKLERPVAPALGGGQRGGPELRLQAGGELDGDGLGVVAVDEQLDVRAAQ